MEFKTTLLFNWASTVFNSPQHGIGESLDNLEILWWAKPPARSSPWSENVCSEQTAR